MNASLVFIDESGFLMAPLVRRSWSPQGQTPVLLQRTRSHKKVSAIAALCIPPSRDQLSFFFRLHPDRNICIPEIVAFLQVLARHLASGAVVIWDRLQAHRSPEVARVLRQALGSRCSFLPPYAPDLNPVEYAWSYLKTGAMANLAPTQLEVLAEATRRGNRALQRNQLLLRSFLAHSPLFLRLR